jgi:DNA-binding LytR/AlgR family response regulator
MEMSKLKVLIVEDDLMISESLKDILQVLNHEVVGVADNADTAIEICNENPPELALLDIQISGDIDGVKLAEIIRDQFDIPFIFTTAYADNETVLRARDKGPFGYLVKPYGVKEVNATIQIAKASFDRLKTAEKAAVNMSKIVDNSLFLKVDSKLIKVKIDDILFVEAKGNYVLIKTNSKAFIVHSTFKHAEERLLAHNFLKVHRSYLVNLSKIIDIEDANLIIENRVIPISKARREPLIKRLNIF